MASNSCGVETTDMSDVFEEDAPNEELDMAGKELKRRLDAIKTAAFHESFEPAKERSLQQAFDTGYGLIYPYFRSIAMLEGVYDGAYFTFVESKKEEDRQTFEDIKPQFATLYSDLLDELNGKIEKDVEEKAVIADNYQPTHIVPSAELLERFNSAKARTLDLCTLAHLNDLRTVVEGIVLLQS